MVVLSGALMFPDETISSLRNYVQTGGNLLVGTVPWASQGKYEDFAEDFPGNRILRESGISFLPRTAQGGNNLLILENNPVVVPVPESSNP